MLVYWKKYEKVEKEHRKRAEKEAMEQRKLDDEFREVKNYWIFKVGQILVILLVQTLNCNMRFGNKNKSYSCMCITIVLIILYK